MPVFWFVSRYVGNLQPQVNENFMQVLFGQMGTCVGCKMIYEPGQDPYCFVEFADHQSAATALNTMNGREVMGKPMRVNWATSPNSKNSAEMARGRVDTSGLYQKNTRPKVDTSDHFHIFCGDLSPDIDSNELRKAFSVFGEISDCKVICDMASNKSKGYGFISFVHKEEAQKAINEMNGAWLGSRAIRTNWATRKPPAPVERVKQRQPQKLNYDEVYAQASETNTTVYIGGIHEGLCDQLLRDAFEPFGAVAEIRCFQDKGFAFVRLEAKDAAAQAIVGLNGSEVGGFMVRCSWGKESNDGPRPQGGAGGYGGYQQQQQGYYPQQGGYGNGYNQQWGGGQQWGGQQQWGGAPQQQWGGQWGAGGDPNAAWQQQGQQAGNWQQQQQGGYQQGYQG